MIDEQFGVKETARDFLMEVLFIIISAAQDDDYKRFSCILDGNRSDWFSWMAADLIGSHGWQQSDWYPWIAADLIGSYGWQQVW